MKVEPTYGTLVYQKEQPEIPATKKVEGNVTINNEGMPAVPAKYFVKHDIAFTTADDLAVGHLSLTTEILAGSTDGQYNSIESAAFERLPSTLRQFADEIDLLLAQDPGQHLREED